MVLKLYNTRTRKKEEFSPLDPSNVRMYVCGPTVYDYAHIGNARPVIVFDVLYRLLRHLYRADHVTYVRNITDVDDKINARAAEQYPDLPLNEAIRKLTQETAEQFHRDVDALGCLRPNHEPRATDYIAQMKDMITQLFEADVAYVADDHVLFSVAAYGKLSGVPRYGSLARRSLDEMIAGARVEVAPYKRDAMDFVLWKPSKEGEPSWPSPLNIRTRGRPGWHLECSAMSKALLGDQFDIHGGGIDLVFPHHENEVAQSCGANSTPKMANVWMHNGFLQVEGQKMSKSLGNFITINELLYTYPGQGLRYNMLKTHYRQPINWTSDSLASGVMELNSWCSDIYHHDLSSLFLENPNLELRPSAETINALSDDLNTPEAVAILRKLAKGSYKNRDKAAQLLADCMFLNLISPYKLHVFENVNLHGNAPPEILGDYVDQTLMLRAAIANNNVIQIGGLVQQMEQGPIQVQWDSSGQVYLSYNAENKDSAVLKQIEARNAARKAKDWVEADRIRDELAAMGIALKDTKDPATGEIVTTWEIAR